MHSPEQARELWCPMARIARREPVDVTQPDGSHKPSEVASVLLAGCNRDALGSGNIDPYGGRHSPLNSCRCIADKCAMWRWIPSATTHKEGRVEEYDFCPGPGRTIEIRQRLIQVDVPDSPTQGYCGLAGRPEVHP